MQLFPVLVVLALTSGTGFMLLFEPDSRLALLHPAYHNVAIRMAGSEDSTGSPGYLIQIGSDLVQDLSGSMIPKTDNKENLNKFAHESSLNK